MICYRCGEEVAGEQVCPVCNADLSIFEKIRHISNAFYNDGLQQATVRNMSGAIISLKASLRFDKTNIEARNLLGLVYYETGEIVDALSEWVISQCYQPKNNLATKYLEDIHENKSQLDAINQTIKKYNQALLYCRQDSKDLAIIQLKKVLSLNPKLVKAHQLLALLYFQNGKLEQAKKTLRDAGKIDANNTRTLRYLKAVNQKIRESGKKKPAGNDELISYQSGNDTIIMPKRFRETSVGSTFLGVIAGIIIGVAVTAFLVVPGVKSKAKAEATKQLLSANDTISTNGLTITDLQSRLDSLQDEYDQLKASNEATTLSFDTYQKLTKAYSLAMLGDVTNAKTIFDGIAEEGLDDTGREVYEMVHLCVDDVYMKSTYDAGMKAYNDKNYESAITSWTKVVSANRDYDGGTKDKGVAVYMLAWAHFHLAEQESGEGGNAENAKLNYQKAITYSEYIVSAYPNTNKDGDAKNIISKAQKKLN